MITNSSIRSIHDTLKNAISSIDDLRTINPEVEEIDSIEEIDFP